jgi:riboflavin synthase
MFTGIVRQIGIVRDARAAAGGLRLRIDLGTLAEGLTLGDSVAVSGVCQTVASLRGSECEFDAIPETLRRSTLGELHRGDRVNLERSLRAGDALDGHIVQGHVDGVATLRRILRDAGKWEMEFACDGSLTGQMVEKGSVAVNGVSLTLARVSDGQFAVALIPTTLKDTTLSDMRPGDRVNVETDVIGKYVQKYLRASSSEGVTLEKLRQAGFLD